MKDRQNELQGNCRVASIVVNERVVLMGLLWFIGLVLLVTILIGGYIAFLKGANSDKQPTPQCNCKTCQDFKTPEEPLVVKKSSCKDCVWRNPTNCRECTIKYAADDGVNYEDHS